MAIISESATVVRNDCVVRNGDAHTVEWSLHANGTGTFPLHLHTHSHTHTHIHTHAHTHAHTNTCTNTPNTRTHTYMYTHTHTHVHVHTHVHTHVDTHTCTHTYTQTHTHNTLPLLSHTFVRCTTLAFVWSLCWCRPSPRLVPSRGQAVLVEPNPASASDCTQVGWQWLVELFWFFGGECIYGKTYVYRQTDRQIRLTYYRSMIVGLIPINEYFDYAINWLLFTHSSYSYADPKSLQFSTPWQISPIYGLKGPPVEK